MMLLLAYYSAVAIRQGTAKNVVSCGGVVLACG